MLQSILSNLDGARDVTNSSSAIKPIDALPTQQARETFSNLQNTQVIQTPDFMAGTPSITDIIGNTVGAKQAATPTTVQASPEKDNTASLLNGDKGGDNKYSDNSSQVPALDQDAFEDVPETGVSLVENFKKLKTSYKTTKETLKAAEARTKELEQKLKDYDTGASVPSVIQDLENKVALSQKWEKLHNLKMSDEYAEEFVKPLDESKRRLSVLAEEYGLDIDDMEHAINLKSERDLNGFLSDKFDSIGAMEVKQLITKSRDIMTRAQAAEQEPAAVMQRLHEENTVRLAAADVARKSKITAVAKSAWREAVDDLQKEGKMTEIILRPDDPEHNENYVKPILTQAGQEFGKIVSMLTEAGVKDLPVELTKALASMTARAHASAVAVASREATVTKLREMEEIVARVTNARSPNMGALGSRGAPDSAPKAVTGYAGDTLRSTAQDLLTSVLSRK